MRPSHYFMFFYLMLITFTVPAQQKQIDSLKHELKITGSDTTKAILYFELSKIELSLSAFDSAFYFAERSLEISEASQYKKGKGTALNFIGNIYFAKGDLNNAKKYYELALPVRQEIKDKSGIASSYNNLANVMTYQGNYSRALEYYLNTLKVREELKDAYGISACQNNIGNLYNYINDLDHALLFLTKALKIREQMNDKPGIAASLNNIGSIYTEKEMHDIALEYYSRSLKIRTELNDKAGIAVSHSNIGKVYEERGDYSRALENYKICLDNYSAIEHIEGVGSSFLDLGTVYLKMKKMSEAEKYLLKSYAICKENQYLNRLKYACLNLSSLYETKGEHKKAFEFYKERIQIADSLNNSENVKKLIQTQMKYDFEKRESIAQAEREKKEAIAQAENRRQKIILFVISGVIVLVLGFALFAYRSFLQKKKTNIEITKQKAIIEAKQKEIVDSIHYAQRIQKALIPSEKYIEKTLRNLN